MRRDVLFTYLENNSIFTGDLLAFYGFNHVSGVYVFNEIYESPVQTISGNLVNKAIYPAYILGCDPSALSIVSGSGTFDGNTAIRVGDRFPHKEWTIFLNYSSEDNANLNLGKTLVSSMTSPTGSSGFNIGLNGSNRLYYEYVNADNNKVTSSLGKELAQKNIVSIARSYSSIDLTYHNVAEAKNHTSVIQVQDSEKNGVDYSYSDLLFFGDFLKNGAGYTGFNGKIDDILIFNSYLPDIYRNNISQAFFATGYSGERIDFENIVRVEITGVGTVEILVTGTGVVGSAFSTGLFIDTKCASGIPQVFLSEVTGPLSGQVVTFATGSGTVTGTRAVIRPEEFFFNHSLVNSYARKNLAINYFIDSSDIFEMYSFTGIKTNLNKTDGKSTFTSDLFLSTEFTGGNLNVYLNGQLLRSGIYQEESMEIASGDYYISPTYLAILVAVPSEDLQILSNGLDIDNIIYDQIPGPVLHTGYSSGTPNLVVGFAQAGSSDVFLNGQKLISGFDYEISGSSVVVMSDQIAGVETGLLSIAPREAFDYRVTGSATSLINNGFELLSEQFWLNGMRQIKDINYFTVGDNSLLRTGVRIEKSTFIIYNNDNGFFNT